MNIWMVNHYSRAPSESGGTRHYSLARALGSRGHSVTIIASSFDYQSLKETRHCENGKWQLEVHQGISFLWMQTPAYSGNTVARLWNMIMFASRVWKGEGIAQLPKPDIILGSSPHPFAAVAAERLAKRLAVPFVLEVRDLWPETLISIGKFSSWHPLILVLHGIERYLYTHAERVITLLPKAWQYLAAKGVKTSKVAYLPNGIDLNLIPQPTEPPVGQLFTLMYAGSHGVANNLDILLDSARILRGKGWGHRVRIRLIGDGPQKPRLRQRALDEGLDLISFEDAVPKAQIYSRLQEADAFVMILKDLPVFRWGLSPNKLFDYLATARPVLFAIQPSLNPVADASAGLSVSPEDPERLAEGIIKLVEMPWEERREMGLRGRRYVEEHYNLSVVASRLEQVLSGISGSCSHKPDSCDFAEV